MNKVQARKIFANNLIALLSYKNKTRKDISQDLKSKPFILVLVKLVSVKSHSSNSRFLKVIPDIDAPFKLHFENMSDEKLVSSRIILGIIQEIKDTFSK